MTYSQIILNLLRNTNEWTPSHQLGKVNTKWGWIGSSGERRARELAEDGLIEVRHVGKYAEYRAKQPKSVTVYKVEGREILTTKMF